MADRCVLDVLIAGLNRAHHHFAGIESDANLDRRSALGAQIAGELFDLLLHPERRQQCALRMVFVGHGSAEQREDAVAGGLHDVAVVAMRGVDHQLQRRIYHAASVFGIKVLHKLGRALDIGEQRGDGLAFAFQLRSR